MLMDKDGGRIRIKILFNFKKNPLFIHFLQIISSTHSLVLLNPFTSAAEERAGHPSVVEVPD